MSPNGSISSEFLPQGTFVSRFHLEQKRTERSRRSFVLMLLESSRLLKAGNAGGTREKILAALSKSIRETDVKGWYKHDSVVGVILTEIGAACRETVANALSTKITDCLSLFLSSEQVSQIDLSFYVFPEDWDKEGGSDPKAYPNLALVRDSKKISLFVKRCIDIAGSSLALIVGLPAFAAIAIAIKLNSKGPVLFRQQRVGQCGNRFTFLKFRSMYVSNDPTIHREYIANLIAGKADTDGKNVYKLTDDPRVTKVGRFLRKTSLDELPQFINTLRGEMSLVGPRPPIPYEVERYEIWHRRRLLDVKPGLTGLWQVTGRSKTTFDDMVRLDLRYAQSWSVWLDIKILWRTPRAVLMGDGAY
jgi:lipopolysaccharide/colanic/teichoic acid biosynthesis glycosyltransferase